MLRKALRREMPAGQFATRSHLVGRGFSVSSIRNLLRSGDMVTLARGVYSQDEPLTVTGILRSLQQMGSDLAAGGETAMRLHGAIAGKPAEVFSTVCLSGRDRIPGWLFRWNHDVKFVRLGTARLFAFGRSAAGTPPDVRLHFVKELEFLGVTFRASSIERALFEMLSTVPDGLSFDAARDLMFQVRGVASQKGLRQLMDLSVNVKVNRLLFWFGVPMGYRCLEGLDAARYVGRGKRQLVAKGRYVRDVQLTVPRDFQWPPAPLPTDGAVPTASTNRDIAQNQRSGGTDVRRIDTASREVQPAAGNPHEGSGASRGSARHRLVPDDLRPPVD